MTAPTSEKSGAPAATLSHTVLQPQGWPIPRGYANGVMTDGGTIFTGGLVCWDAEGKFPAGFGAQAHQTFRSGRGARTPHPADLVCHRYRGLSRRRQGAGAAYRDVFGKCFPAMATVEVNRLVEREALIEIEATAVLPKD